MTQANTITLDGITHNVSDFSQAVQAAVNVYNTFNADLQREQLAAMKTQAAMQAIGSQITEAVKKELAEKAAEAQVAANEEKPAE